MSRARRRPSASSRRGCGPGQAHLPEHLGLEAARKRAQGAQDQGLRAPGTAGRARPGPRLAGRRLRRGPSSLTSATEGKLAANAAYRRNSRYCRESRRRPTCVRCRGATCRKSPLELRRYLIQTVSRQGGHFAAGLGTVELTVALHYVFQTPHDRLVWDVGHQAYPHKVLTGRRDRLSTIKQPGGWRRSRRAAKASTTPSASAIRAPRSAPPSAWRSRRRRAARSRRAVAVIGDGALTAGMAFEALNHAGSLNVALLVVLNDNDMSISENVGALSNYFASCSPAGSTRPARGRQEGAAPDADRVGTRAPLRGARQGHGPARHDVRGDGLQLHRADRRPRSEGAAGDAREHARSCTVRSCCTS